MAREKSPCLRRRYAAQIISEGEGSQSFGVNSRESQACTEMICARTRFSARHGQQVEICGEIHAEQSALIWYKPYGGARDADQFLISGWDQTLDRELLGRESYPCHVCALMIKHAKFETVVLRGSDREIQHISIDQIIEEREQEWETH